MSDENLRIPTIQVAVELAFLGGETHSVELFLADREQHLIDLLEGEQQFLPAHELADDGWSAFNKATLRWASIPLQDGQLPVEEARDAGSELPLYDHRVDVRFEWAGGQSLVGELLYNSPEGHDRPSDFLNEPGQFVRLWTADQLYLVNKDHVARVVELEATSREGMK